MIAHWMPCKIDADGANVNMDLMPIEELNSKEERLTNTLPKKSKSLLSSNFRGRPLKGIELELPSNYKPLIISHNMSEHLNDNELEPITFGSNQVDKIILWNLSTEPNISDPIPLSLAWLHLADSLHSDC